MSESADSFADEPIGEELVPVEGELVSEARPLATAGGAGEGIVVAKRATLRPAGFVAFMLVRVLRRPDAARSVARRRKRLLARRRGPEIAGSRSFLVDVHLLKR